MRRLFILFFIIITCHSAQAASYYKAPWAWSELEKSWEPPAGSTYVADCRTIREQSISGGVGGYGIFSFPNGTISVKNGSLVASTDEAMMDYMEDLYTKKSDPSGLTGPKPIMPTSDMKLEYWVNGKVRRKDFSIQDQHFSKVIQIEQENYKSVKLSSKGNFNNKYLGGLGIKYGISNPEDYFIPNDLPKEKPINPSTTLDENFNTSDGPVLGPNYVWTQINNPNFTIVSNQVQVLVGAGSVWARCESDLSSVDHYSQVTLSNYTETGNNLRAGCFTRLNTNSTTISNTVTYTVEATWGPGPGEQLQIRKIVNGTTTGLASPSVTISAGDVVKSSVSGSTVKSFQNGVQVSSVTDTSVSGGTRCAIYGFNQTGGTQSNLAMDNWEASDSLDTHNPQAYII